jgi:hypothetical protein
MIQKLLLTFFVSLSYLSFSGPDAVCETWWTPEKDAKIRFYKAKNGFIYGKIEWLQTPNNEDGTPVLDLKNPDPEKRTQPKLGLVIFKKMEYTAENKWTGGTVYDSRTGKTYNCELSITEDGLLEVRGYIGSPLLGQSKYFTPVK